MSRTQRSTALSALSNIKQYAEEEGADDESYDTAEEDMYTDDDEVEYMDGAICSGDDEPDDIVDIEDISLSSDDDDFSESEDTGTDYSPSEDDELSDDHNMSDVASENDDILSDYACSGDEQDIVRSDDEEWDKDDDMDWEDPSD